ncbi:MAG: hypothetical protein WAO76_13490 [Georgfuchsia sp.]
MRGEDQHRVGIDHRLGVVALLDTRIADPALYTNPDRSLLEQLLKRQTDIAQSIETAEGRWLQTQEALETLSS